MRGTCDHCGGNSSFYLFKDTGIWHCFKCGYRILPDGYVYNPKEPDQGDIRGIRAYYTEMAHYYHSNVDARVRSYLNCRGITDKLIEQFKLGYCPREVNTRYNDEYALKGGLGFKGKAFLGGRVIFPYFGHFGKVVYDLRGRSLDPDEDIRYLSPFGPNILRGATIPYNVAATYSTGDLIVTEGEIKSLSASKLGLNAIALAGIRSSKIIPPQYRDDQNIIICFDSQRDYKQVIRPAIIDLVRRLNYPHDCIKVAYLPLLNRDKMDIDDFIALEGAHAFLNVIRRAMDYHKWLKWTMYL